MIATRVLLIAVACCATLRAQRPSYLDPPISYGSRPSQDPVARLAQRLDAGDELAWDERMGYLPAVLDALGISPSTQGLVFSKTSFQHQRISPQRPRAVFFGDDVYLGYVPGTEVLELTGMDPRDGPVFYTLNQDRDRPQIERRDAACLSCHGASLTQGWPGNIVRSVHPDPDGHPRQNARSYVTDHESPFARRWGGWFVTGEIEGGAGGVHMGNAISPDANAPEELDRSTQLRRRWDSLGDVLAIYPSAHSDLVALMVLEHQTGMHDRLALASYRVRRAQHQERISIETMGTDPAVARGRTQQVVRDAADDVLQYLLFKNEARLPGPARGSSAFAATFPATGRRDAKGRSLRDLDLQTRLFAYPCSYVIHSPCFDALPDAVRDVVYQRLWRILTGRFGRASWGLTRAQRQAILEILLETKPGLPSSWRHVEVR